VASRKIIPPDLREWNKRHHMTAPHAIVALTEIKKIHQFAAKL